MTSFIRSCLGVLSFFTAFQPPTVMIFTIVNQICTKQGVHLLFFLGSLCCKGGPLLAEFSLWCVSPPIISGSSLLSPCTLLEIYLDVFCVCCHQRWFKKIFFFLMIVLSSYHCSRVSLGEWWW